MELPPVDQLVRPQSITYVGIGTCRRSLEPWSSEENQQYPMFLRQHPDLSANLILFDPGFVTENPPYCVSELQAQPNTGVPGSSLYRTEKINIYVYPWRVTYLPSDLAPEHPTQNVYDLTPFFASLNQVFSHRTDCVLVVHDFSGLDLDKLALYFDSTINHHQILYDLSTRQGIGCLMDWSRLVCQIIQEGPCLRVFNPFGIPLDCLSRDYRTMSHPMTRQHIHLCANFHTKLFLEWYFHNLRRTKLWMSSTSTHALCCKKVFKRYQLRWLDYLHHTHLSDSYQRDDLQYMWLTLVELYTMKCHQLGQIFRIDPYQLMECIYLEEDANRWLTPLSHNLSTFMLIFQSSNTDLR